MNWRWPAKRGNGLAPWYQIGWRCIWWLPIMSCMGLLWLFIALAQGPRDATEAMRDLM